MTNRRPTLQQLIDRGKADQNGYGYEDFCKIARLPKRMSYTSVSVMFNRNVRTIIKWFERYDEEVK